MASTHAVLQKTSVFIENSIVEVFVPEVSEIDWSATINSEKTSSRRNGRAMLDGLKQRDVLFLDELVTVSVVLQAPFVDEEEFKGHLQRLSISVEANAVGTVRPKPEDQDQQPAPLKDQLDLRKLEDLGDPLVVIEDLSDDPNSSPKPRIYCVWPVELHLDRTKIRSSNPSAFFSAALTIQPPSIPKSPEVEDDYLVPGVPGSMNVLEALNSIPSLKENPPTLSAAKLSKITPSNLGTTELLKPLRNANPTLLRLRPALNSRVRLSHIGTSPSFAKVLASLDIEVSSLPKGDVILETFEFALSNGQTEPVGNLPGVAFPHVCKQRDSLSFVFNLRPNESNHPSSTCSDPLHTLTFSLIAKVGYIDGTYLPLKVAWRSEADLSTLNKQATPSSTFQSLPSSKPLAKRPDSTTSQLSNLITLTITSHAPSHTLSLGSHFRWSLLLTNRSATRTLRLALIPLTSSIPASTDHPPPTRHPTTATHTRKPTLPSSAFALTPDDAADAVDAAGAPPSQPHAPGLVPLTPDLRVGPIAPGACVTAEMRFLVAGRGIVGLRALRVVDLEAGKAEDEGGRKVEWVDVGAELLPRVVGVEREKEDERDE